MATILAIDDDPRVLELIRRSLTPAGLRVQTVDDALDAWEYLESERPDLVLCDIFMPAQDGLEFLRELRRRGPELGLEGVPVIAISGGIDQLPANAMLHVAHVLGARMLIRKPFRLSTLRDACLEALERPVPGREDRIFIVR